MKKKRSYLFGFRRSRPDETGFLAVGPRGYFVTPDRASAFPLSPRRPRGAAGWAPPEKWLEFFRSEIPDWKFHLVDYYD